MLRRSLAATGLVSLAFLAAACGSTTNDAAQPTRTVPRGSAPASTVPTTLPKTCTPTTATPPAEGKPTITVKTDPAPTTLQINDIKVGEGPEAKAGDELQMQYVGVLYKDGTEFDSSWSRNAEPIPVTLGSGGVIPGWEQGLVGMKVGGRRELIIPPDLAYGAQGSPPKIGPNETLVFVVDLQQLCTTDLAAATTPGSTPEAGTPASTTPASTTTGSTP